MRKRSEITQDRSLGLVGGSNYGIDPKISPERTYNMFISDNWLLSNPGYKKVATILDSAEGRGIYGSTRFNHMIAVIDDGVYIITPGNSFTRIATIASSTGDAFICENEKREFAICDKVNIYIYNYATGSFTTTSLDFIPQYIAYQDGRFISCGLVKATGQPQWRLCDITDSTSWPDDTNHAQTFNEADQVMATVPFPGKKNVLVIFGKVTSQFQTDVGYQLFPYQLNTYYNVDFGCLNQATIASNDEMVVWLGVNEKSGPAIRYSNGGKAERISTDGIDEKLSQLKHPEVSYGFMFEQNGHQIYQIAFPKDNFSMIYDFKTGKPFDVCDSNMNCHIAKRITHFNNTYYFVSFVDGNLYELNSKYTNFDGAEIQRLRIPPTIRFPNSRPFVTNNVTFPIKQGQSPNPQRVDISISDDGGVSFGNYVGYDLNTQGNQINMFDSWNLGQSNELTLQIRFWGDSSFVVGEGLASVYQ